MERLTFTDEQLEKLGLDCPVKGGDVTDRFCTMVCDEFQYDCPFMKMAKKLKIYEDKQEQGLLIELPCKVGDTVYKLWYKPCHYEVEYPDSYECCGCEDECDLKKEIYEFKVPSLDWVLKNMKHFGDCVWFLTRCEAEEELAKMGE